ncbi:MAG: hypothetical protein GF364_22710 [Candidatus Lokiarchaeota archaeon]|nr:hypothetical protein [Candidatus Lokiarchaeota archaeon]
MKELENIHWIGGLAPDADRFSGTVNTDVFEVQGEGAVFLIWYGTNGSNGASTLTIEACDDTTPTNTTAIPFYYRTSTTFDTWGSWTAATSAGITVGGSADSMWQIWVPASELASEGYAYVQADLVESTDQAADGMVLAGVVNPRYKVQPSSLID